VPLGEKVIHSVHNPLQQLTAALHVYGGNFFDTPRSEWDALTLEERPYSVEHTMQAFEASNALLRVKPAAAGI
jgi:predicted metal-dependent enzyme (double-stranded beta helix superfamily)